ncbi:tyrosine-type recombinase/integrase [Bacillus albus]|uniref:site-specific integrase n=1 Tax=Bacillus albus TaxID=2026189 RepID=UPI001021C67E|nr:site-specific integrase [Bacillus albus]
MAHFRKRGKKWYFQIDLGIDPTTGKHKHKSKGGFTTKKEAQIAAAQMEKELFENTYIEEKDILFQDFAKEWLELYSETVKISSIRAREKQMNVLIKFLGNRKMKEIGRKEYQRMLNDLNKIYAFNTMDGIHTCGRIIFKKAIELEVIKNNPLEFVVLPKKQQTVEELEEQKNEIKYLEKEELALFLNTAKETGLESDYVTFSLLAYTGIRVGELLALKWSDVDFEENTISITKTMYNPNNITGKYELLTPKTKGSIRKIKLDEYIIKTLKKHNLGQKQTKLMLGDNYIDSGFIITKISGEAEFVKTIQNRLKRLLKLTKINKKITPHSFRHTHTSLLIEAGVGIKEIQQRLGHTDIETTMNIYAHMTKNMEEKASQKFSELMRSLRV